jgi:hypothetical protein
MIGVLSQAGTSEDHEHTIAGKCFDLGEWQAGVIGRVTTGCCEVAVSPQAG